MTLLRGSFGCAAVLALLSVAACSSPTADETTPSSSEADVTSTGPTAAKTLLAWNATALDAVALDSTPAGTGAPHAYGAQPGPARTARALAIVHIAIYDAVQSIAGTYVPYTEMAYDSHANMAAAIGQAAHDTLVALYPSQAASFDAALKSELAANRAASRDLGVARGKLAAANILALRDHDGSETPDPKYVDMNLPTGEGMWAPDQISKNPTAVGGYWMKVKPFTMTSADQFRAPPPYAMGSAEWQQDFTDVLQNGGDGVTTPTQRTAEETIIGTFWGYDGASKIGTPPRFYNQITNVIADKRGYTGSPVEMSRLLAVVNTSLADAGIACWDTKYFYNLWRPSNAIRDTPADQGGNASWMPLGAMASNTTVPEFTPPFPSYPSGHACFGGALFDVLEKIVGDTSFTVVSDEYNGQTTDKFGHVRPRTARSYAHLKDAETENARSRIFLGVHWQNDGVSGITMGNQVGDQVLAKFFQRRTIASN